MQFGSMSNARHVILHAPMEATTPSGVLRSWHETAPDTCKVRPAAASGRLQAYSTVSFPLATSARAWYT